MDLTLSSGNNDWSTSLSFVVPNLHVLSLSGCSIFGPVLSSLSGFHFISDISLSKNNISTEVRDSWEITLLWCPSIFRIADCKVSSQKVYSNYHTCKLLRCHSIQISLAPSQNSLNVVLFSNCHSHPQISTGSYQSRLETFRTLLSYCLIIAISLEQSQMQSELSQLGMLELSSNNSLFTLPLLEHLSLWQNWFNGLSSEVPNTHSPFLVHLDLRENSLQGHVSQLVFELMSLNNSNLSSNNLSGIMDIDIFVN